MRDWISWSTMLLVGAAAFGCAPVQNAAEGTGNLVKEGYQQVAEATSDSAINFAVKAGLIEDDTILSRDIQVFTEGGVVTLSGSQPTEAGVHRAEEIARRVKGVRDVRNMLVVTPPPEPAPAAPAPAPPAP